MFVWLVIKLTVCQEDVPHIANLMPTYKITVKFIIFFTLSNNYVNLRKHNYSSHLHICKYVNFIRH
jgi:hypothetical protein